MTELNHAPEAEEPNEEHAPAGLSWPTLPAGFFAERPDAVQDPAITAVLERLGALPGTPVSGHDEVYSRLHEELMEALNEDVTGHSNATRDASS